MPCMDERKTRWQRPAPRLYRQDQRRRVIDQAHASDLEEQGYEGEEAGYQQEPENYIDNTVLHKTPYVRTRRRSASEDRYARYAGCSYNDRAQHVIVYVVPGLAVEDPERVVYGQAERVLL